MKQLLLLAIFSFFSNSFCLGQELTKFELQEERKLNITLRGKVKSIQVKTENSKSDSIDSLVYFFDKEGLPDKIIFYGLGFDALARKFFNAEVHYSFEKNKLTSKLNKRSFGRDGDIYEYDKNWNLISKQEFMSNILIKETLFKYDFSNRLTERTEYLFGGFSNYNPLTQEGKANYLYQIEKFEYSNSDKVIRKLTYHFRENKTVQISHYRYDLNDNLIEEGNCLSYGDPNCEIKPLYGYEYNSKNLLVKEFQFAKFSPHNTDQYYSYDEKGNKVESKGIYISSDKEPRIGYHYVLEYDQYGNVTKEEEITGNGNRMIGFEKYRTHLSQYDKFQNLLSEEYISVNGTAIKLVQKVYTYDKQGNWLKMETFAGTNKDDIKLEETSTRTIQYLN